MKNFRTKDLMITIYPVKNKEGVLMEDEDVCPGPTRCGPGTRPDCGGPTKCGPGSTPDCDGPTRCGPGTNPDCGGPTRCGPGTTPDCGGPTKCGPGSTPDCDGPTKCGPGTRPDCGGPTISDHPYNTVSNAALINLKKTLAGMQANKGAEKLSEVF